MSREAVSKTADLGAIPSGRAIPFGVVAQLVSAPTCRVEGYGFESRRRRHFNSGLAQLAERGIVTPEALIRYTVVRPHDPEPVFRQRP